MLYELNWARLTRRIVVEGDRKSSQEWPVVLTGKARQTGQPCLGIPDWLTPLSAQILTNDFPACTPIPEE